jgi:hypothetical protein
MTRRHSIPGLILAAALAAAGAPVWAQNIGTDPSLANDPNLNPSLAPQPRVVFGTPPGATPAWPQGPDGAWGTQQGATWIAASQFTVPLSIGAPTLTYSGNHFYSSPGSASPTRYFAQLQVEPGVLINHLSCVYNDPSATNDVTFVWQKYTTHLITGVSTSVTIDSFTTTGTPGVGFDSLDGPETMSTYDGGFNLINHYIAADVAGDTRIAGCWAFWTRQVAPAPATATFNDVPTSHIFFQFIEALAASGITGGCQASPPLYCPDNPVTRGQMATFLAKALGLGFPY